MTIRKLFNAALGFTAGVFTSALAAIVWPFLLAWFMYRETDGGNPPVKDSASAGDHA